MSNEKIFNKYYYLGNREIINHYKVGFLCSRKVTAEKILKIYDWAIEQREKGVCVVSGFHSKIEKDVFHYLSKGRQPIILVLARGLFKRYPKQMSEMVESGRLLVISEFDESVKRVTKETARIRNKLNLELSNEVVVGHVSQGGNLAQLITSVSNKISIHMID